MESHIADHMLVEKPGSGEINNENKNVRAALPRLIQKKYEGDNGMFQLSGFIELDTECNFSKLIAALSVTALLGQRLLFCPNLGNM